MNTVNTPNTPEAKNEPKKPKEIVAFETMDKLLNDNDIKEETKNELKKIDEVLRAHSEKNTELHMGLNSTQHSYSQYASILSAVAGSFAKIISMPVELAQQERVALFYSNKDKTCRVIAGEDDYEVLFNTIEDTVNKVQEEQKEKAEKEKKESEEWAKKEQKDWDEAAEELKQKQEAKTAKEGDNQQNIVGNAEKEAEKEVKTEEDNPKDTKTG